MCIGTQSRIQKQVTYFISKNHTGLLEHSNPFQYSPGSHSQSVSCSVGITSYLLASSISALSQPQSSKLPPLLGMLSL